MQIFLNFEKANLIYTIFLIMVFLILILGVYLVLSVRIKIDVINKKVYYYKYKKIVMDFNDIQEAIIDTSNSINSEKYFTIKIICKNKNIFLGQYVSITNKSSWFEAQKIIDTINSYVSKKL
jgi:hypothetical protein